MTPLDVFPTGILWPQIDFKVIEEDFVRWPEVGQDDPLKGLRRENWKNLERLENDPF